MSDVRSSNGSGAETSDVILQVDEINTYYGLSHVLHDVSLDIRTGETVALVGRNGAGKTTTLRSIMGLTPSDSGQIVFKGDAIHGREPHEIRQLGISWVPEDRRVFPHLTVHDNLEMADSSGGESGQIERMYERFPRLDERREQDAGTLSGGEQQMLAIARALVGPATDLLMLDEPSEGLAPQIVDDVREIIRDLNAEGVTTLLVEQNAELALELSNRAFVIETGRIVHEGSATDLLEDEDKLEKYLGVS